MSTTNEHLQNLFTIQVPNGHIIHTLVNLSGSEAIREFIEQEEAITLVANIGRMERGEPRLPKPNWEQFEAQGFKVVPISIVLR